MNGGWYQPCLSLKVASALNVKVMEIPTSVDASELWLRDDLEEVYALLFRFFGFGFRLAMSNEGWLVTQKFVILVPDPIAFAPRPALLDPGEPFDICQYTSSDLPLRGFLSHHGTKTTRAMAFPGINCRTTTATVLTATATVTLSLRACLFLCYTPITSPSAAEAAQRLRLDEEQEEHGQERLAL